MIRDYSYTGQPDYDGSEPDGYFPDATHCERCGVSLDDCKAYIWGDDEDDLINICAACAAELAPDDDPELTDDIPF